MNTMQEKIRGCLVAGAAGDALGYPVEFMSYRQIVGKYGPQGITRYELNRHGVAEISDDTQMTLFTANGLVIDDIQTAYLEWYHTQTSGDGTLAGAKCWLSDVPAMYSRRAPGTTCMSALHNIKQGYPVHNDSKGCGGIMRVAPVGIYGAVNHWDIEQTARVACEAARMTHKHPMGWIPAGEFAVFIQQLLSLDEASRQVCLEDPNNLGDMLASSGQAVREYIREIGNPEDVVDMYIDYSYAVSNALCLTDSGKADEEAIRSIGEGWTGDEAFEIALYCMFKHLNDPAQAIIAAVNHSGDSDSTGAITGNLMGALHGYNAIPDHFKQNLELHDTIMKIADELNTNR